MAEQTFLNEGGVYVSNSRVVIHGTTYSTANITSVRKGFTPASTGCATILILVGVLSLLGGLVTAFISGGKDAAPAFVIALITLIMGIAWFKSQRPVYHVMLATASGERQGLSSPDDMLVSRVTDAIADAITFRG